ncbi:hypothetical protein EHS13_29215 [Paenibacillus psychroresistens]|uniref:Uncharacterized protein n=1 Tax=Paenibacillus psychroresistens TaxID=1778678 RepID=A0A6B8RT97_9BACL|nr:hypothetical protein [Paenibacillus psychroresistens]QGQ98673.1 hypothetical protein EHS13_29215 [Paenibacillus psychroresistens]
MQWEEVKDHYPSQWVLIEAIDATSQFNKRIVEEISIVDSFNEDSKEALKKYIQLHRANKDRELYVVHTSREHLEIEEKIWTGIRANP